MQISSEVSKLIKPEQVRRILIINLGGIGDVLLSTPALRSLRKFYAQSQIAMVVVPRVYELAQDIPFIDKVFTLSLEYKINNIFKNLETLVALRKRKFDIAVNMRTIVSRRSAFMLKILLDIINPRLKVGRDTDGRGYFFDIKIPETLVGKKYEMEYDIDTVRTLGAEPIDTNIDLEIKDRSKEIVKKILKDKGILENEVIICINPGGKPFKRWPVKYFSEITNKISEKIKCRFLITGTQNEIDLGNKLRDIAKIEMISLAGDINLNEFLALLKRCVLFISNDTGSIHLAAVLKTPLVAIFGPGDIIRFDPRNISDKTVVLYKKVDCAPCNRSGCKKLKCLKAIFPEEVLEASLKLLKD